MNEQELKALESVVNYLFDDEQRHYYELGETLDFDDDSVTSHIFKSLQTLKKFQISERAKSLEYNGWSNYATWRVNLEMVDGSAEFEEERNEGETYESVYDLSEHIKSMIEDYITLNTENNDISNTISGYALAFLEEVNWIEIAEHVIEKYPSIIKSE